MYESSLTPKITPSNKEETKKSGQVFLHFSDAFLVTGKLQRKKKANQAKVNYRMIKLNRNWILEKWE